MIVKRAQQQVGSKSPSLPDYHALVAAMSQRA